MSSTPQTSFQRLRRPMIYLCCFVLLPALIALVYIVHKGSQALLQPGAFPLGERHLAVLADPGDYGLSLTPFEMAGKDAVALKGLLLEPAADPGKAVKFRAMQALMREKGEISVPRPEERLGTILFLHGRQGRKEHVLAIAERFCAAGFRCLAFDARACGESSGKFVTYGFHEVADTMAVMDQAEQKFGVGLRSWGLFGISMGGAVGLQTLPRESRLKCAVGVAVFSDLHREINELAGQRFGSIGRASVPLICWWTRKRSGFDPRQCLPIQFAPRITQPVLLVHGLADTYTSPAQGMELFQAMQQPGKVWRPVADGTHTAVLMAGGDELYHEMNVFFRRHLR